MAENCCVDIPLEQVAIEAMTFGLEQLSLADPSRENSLAKTKLEEAMMWCNKDRTIKGQLKPNKTHVQAE